MNHAPGPENTRPDAEPAANQEPPATRGFSVVGIGASAGGLEAFRLLLHNLPADTGLAIVLIQHLDPTHQSSLSDILGRVTTMPVTDASDGAPVEPNHIYVIPPNAELTIANRILNLRPRSEGQRLHMPIDRFLRSLAHDCRSKAIGVILSGAGSDGALGLQAVKEAGGVTFVQEPGTAVFASMPQMAVAGTCADFVLSPAGIAAELARIAQHPHFAVGQPVEPDNPPKSEVSGFQRIFDVMRESTGIDFSLYREKLVKRRVLRRLALRNIASMEAYAKLLAMDPGECTLLNRDLLISVTNFFRDPRSFEALTTLVFPAMVENQPAGAVLRIWVPGCATGEEAYSLAISLQEYLQATGAAFRVQIFASDISEAAIETARAGRYLENIAADVSPERLNRFFTKIEGGYQVSKSLRELCVFSRHNLIDDPPFARLDLISCRNVLIYLGAVQKNIISLFHYALKPNGFLILGQSERANTSDLFSNMDSHHRIYAKNEIARRAIGFRARAGTSRGEAGNAMAEAAKAGGPWDSLAMERAVDRILLSKFSPAALLMDEGLQVLEVRGDATPFFRLPVGRVSFHLWKLVPDTGLLLEIEKLVRASMASGAVERRAGVPYECDGIVSEVNLEAIPLNGNKKRALLVLLIPARERPEQNRESDEMSAVRDEAIARKDREVAKLKQDVLEARRRLMSVIDEHQLSDEESQTASEEALSANEELQSLNEELETAKEELQSTNEELLTVNQELESKNVALTGARHFAMSIVETVSVPLLVLNADLRIHTVNEAFARSFRVGPREAEQQLLSSLAGGCWNIPGLRNLLDRVLPSGESFDGFEVEWTFPVIGTRALIVNGRRLDDLDLILVSIDDITGRKEAERTLQKSQEALRQAQKVQALGRLAGGIAHDFNNLLTAIIGYTQLVKDSLPEGHEGIEYALEIASAGQKAAALTDQLLAFSRRKVLQPKLFDLNLVVGEFEKMLRHLLGELIQIVVLPALDLWQVRTDSGEIGRALMNLCLNARDAMPTGGTLTIQTRNVSTVDADDLPHSLAAGPYVELAVRDTGLGIEPEIQSRIFEPFFTTKETGMGTGLGLATVYGIVEQSGGAIWCRSKPGHGTTFKILLPATAIVAEGKDRPPADQAEELAGNAEVVLLVDDEDAVRRLASKVLKGRGYVVLEARDGKEGLSVFEAHPGNIDLLVSDVVMPELGGRELADRILEARPETKVLFMSGHMEDVVLREGIKAGTPFLQKPFSPADLARKVRELLDAQSRPRSAGED